MKEHSQNEPKTPRGSKARATRLSLPQSAWRRRFTAVPYVIGVIAIVCIVGYVANRIFPVAYNSVLPTARKSPTTMPSADADVTAFYRKEISPLLDAALKRNREAADRAIALLHERFNNHRAGARPFADDVSGWMTRFGVIGRFANDQWVQHVRGNPKANAVGNYIQDKFRGQVLSEGSLQADLEEVLKQYREDLTASRNQLFAEIRLPLRGSQSPIVLDDQAWESFCLDVDKRARTLNATTPRDGVVTGLASVGGGWIGTEAAEAVVMQILARVGTAVAVESAEAATVSGGSAMVSGTATGGGVGSLGGPAGTAIGVGVGLVIGTAIDWWMTDRMEAKVIDQCYTFLDTVERQIVDGGAKSPGLRASFEAAIRIQDQNSRKVIIDALVEAR